MMGRTLLAPVSYGLGDLVVSLPAIDALVSEDRPVWLVSRAPSQRLLAERIVGLAGVVDEATLALSPGDRLIDLRDHPLQRDYWWGSAAFEATFGRLNINDILQRICVDFGINADFIRPLPLQAKARRDLEHTILLVHESDGIYKNWTPHCWAEVAAMVQAGGHRVAHVTKGDGPSTLDALNIPGLVAPTLPEVVDALSGCRGVIGIDTGLTHIAVQQGTPTVTICRPGSVYVRPWPHCAALRGSDCTARCIAAETRYAYNQTVSLRDFRPTPRICPSGSPCLAQVQPADAVGLLRALL
jgi:hypothetical protein